MKYFLIALIWLTYIWGSAYTFFLFPWGADMKWWYVTHLFTLLSAVPPLTKLSEEIIKI